MTRPQFRARTHRARQILETVGRAYPGAWQAMDRFRALRGTDDLPNWPDWCYVPVHGAYAVVSGGGEARVPYGRSHHTGIVAALAAWRMSQLIIRYDPALYAPLIDTPVSGDLPTELLYRLPVWCLYLETPEVRFEGRPVHGAWVHLDWTADGPDELRLVLDTATAPEAALDAEAGLVPIPLLLGEGTVADALQRVFASGERQAAAHGYVAALPAADHARKVAEALAPILSLLLYLCSEAADWGSAPPVNPAPKRTRRDGWRLFAADGPRTWDVGVRMGAALRRAYAAEQTGQAGEHAGPRGHVRRAHWHGFRSGPLTHPDGSKIPTAQRRFDLRWLPPIAVKLDTVDELPAVVRTVR